MISAERLPPSHTEGSCQSCGAHSTVRLLAESGSSAWTTRFCNLCAMLAIKALQRTVLPRPAKRGPR